MTFQKIIRHALIIQDLRKRDVKLRYMKMLAYVVEMAFAIVMTFGFCMYIGHLFGQIVIGIFAGFILSLSYLIWIIIKNLR